MTSPNTQFIQIPSAGGGGGGAGDNTASYLLVSGTTPDPQGLLTSPRQLTAGANITITDGGALGNLTIAATSNIPGPVGSIFNGGIGQVGSTPFIVTTQSFLFVTTSVGDISISLPVPTTSGTIIFKDVSGDANSNPFTVYPTGGATIDTVSASYTFSVNYGALKLMTDGKSWYTW